MHKNPDMFEIASEVTDERSFIRFLGLLAEDREKEKGLDKGHPSHARASGSLGWENVFIEDFLESASAWGSATIDAEYPTKPENPWTRAAQIICAGKSYE